MNRYLAGAVGGLVATIPMTAAMLLLFRRLPPMEQYPLPPREITMEVASRVGQKHRLPETARTNLSLLAHFGYGALTGGLYPALGIRPRHPVIGGSIYGIAVWALSYLGWIPALKILHPATRHPPPRRRLMLIAHAVWGAGTTLITERLSRTSGHQS